MNTGLTAYDLDALDITQNIKRARAGSTLAYIAGWRARETGGLVNPYARSPSSQSPEWFEWHAGNAARGDIGFDYSHRIDSGTRLGPFQY